jgi:predicted DNA-binding transcriptional regulator AlpA
MHHQSVSGRGTNQNKTKLRSPQSNRVRSRGAKRSLSLTARSPTCDGTNLLDKEAVARFLQVSVKTLDRWIYEHRGPKCYKVGGVLVRYRYEDLIAFLEACPTGGGAAIQPAAESARLIDG